MSVTPGDGDPVLFFDGVCNLCNGSVQWIIGHDSKRRILFAALQSDYASTHLPVDNRIDRAALDTLIFVHNGEASLRSTGVLKMSALLDKPWCYVRVLLVIPRPIRDFVYRIVARYRYRWFGKTDECWVPTPELRARFVS